MANDWQVGVSNEEIKELIKEKDPETKDFLFQQTMYRIKDPRKSIPFYTGPLGMTLLQKLDFPAWKFSLFFMGFEDDKDAPGELGSKERTEWALSKKATLELTHNWGSELDPEFQYYNGNSHLKGFGHIGIMVPNLDEACKRFEELGVKFIKRPTDGKLKTIAFIADPDGYWIEIFNNKQV